MLLFAGAERGEMIVRFEKLMCRMRRCPSLNERGFE